MFAPPGILTSNFGLGDRDFGHVSINQFARRLKRRVRVRQRFASGETRRRSHGNGLRNRRVGLKRGRRRGIVPVQRSTAEPTFRARRAEFSRRRNLRAKSSAPCAKRRTETLARIRYLNS